MLIGPLRHRVTLQSKSTGQDAAGEELRTYTNLASNPAVWADVRPMPAGGERFLPGAEQLLVTVIYNVTIRYRNDLTNRMHVVWESKTLDIEGIRDPSGKREYLILQCREVQA